MGNSVGLGPVATMQDKDTNSPEKPEDTNKVPDKSCVVSAMDAKLTTPAGITSRTVDTETPDRRRSKALSSPPKQITKNVAQDNISTVFDPKSPEVLPSKVPTSNISRFSRLWTSLQNLKGRSTIQRGNTANTASSMHLDESDADILNNRIQVTKALAGIKGPQNTHQIVDYQTTMIGNSDRSTKVSQTFKTDDELITELLDGLMTCTIPTNVENDLRGRRRSTYYPTSKSVSRMVSRPSEVRNISTSPLPLTNNMEASAAEMREILDNIFVWDFNLLRLEELTGKRPLLYVGLKVFQTFGIPSFLHTDAMTFKKWLNLLERNYNENAYHNSSHAADVLQAAASLCSHEKLVEVFDDMDVVSTLLSAAIHDLDHPGKTSSFLINSRHKLAILYNDISVLENHHTALAFQLTFKEDSSNILLNLEKDDFRILRQQIIDMVLATDMTKHFDYLATFKDIMRQPPTDPIPSYLGTQIYPVEFRTIVKRMLIMCCDVSNATRPVETSKVWAKRITEEFCLQTEEEQTKGLQVTMPTFDKANCNIPKTQLSFIKLFIINMMNSWNEFCPVPDLIRNLEINVEYWQQFSQTTGENNSNGD